MVLRICYRLEHLLCGHQGSGVIPDPLRLLQYSAPAECHLAAPEAGAAGCFEP